MTEKRFDIVVQDKVAKTIAPSVREIGTAAGGTRTMLAAMRAEMAGLSSAAGGLGSTVSASTRAMREEAAAANTAAKAASAQRREAEALTKALREQAQALKDLRQAQTVGAGAGSSGGAGPTPGAAPSTPTPRPSGGSSPNTANAARSIREVGEASKLSAQSAANLGFQLNDVFVSLASGQKPMTVFIQQGAQIAQIPAMAGVTWKQFGQQALNTLGIVQRTGDAALDAAAAQAAAAQAAVAAANGNATANVRVAETEVALATAQQQAATTANEQAAAAARLTAANEALAASNSEAAVTAKALATAEAQAAEAQTAANGAATRSIGRLGTAGLIAGAALAVAAGGLATLTREANNDSGLKKYTKEMGYTASEVKKLNAVTVTWGDTAKAVFQVAWKNIAASLGITTTELGKKWKSVLDWMAEVTRGTIAGIYAGFTGMQNVIPRLVNNIKTGKKENLFELVGGSFKEQYKEAQSFMDDVVKQARKNAGDRQDAMAADMINPKKQPKGPKPWDRAQEWKNANGELDAQISLLGKYGDELERAQQLEQIGKVFREHNMPLTAAENKILADKIKLLQDGRRVQEAMTAAEEAANGPQRQFNATQEALNRLLDAGTISLAEYNRQMNLAQRAFEDATNPLAELNRELERSGEIVGLYGKDRNVAEYIQSLQRAAEARGGSIYKQEPQTVSENGDIVVTGRQRPQLTDEAQSMVDEYKRQQKQGDFAQAFESIDPKSQERPGDNSYILDNYKAMYEEIARLREEDVLSEGEAAERKKNLDRAYLDARLEYTGTILGNLTVLQQSKNKEIAAIGKAAAIAQATIDGISAVQAALKGPPGPPWSFAIAATTGIAAAANVAKIAGIGFTVGGHTGYGANDNVKGTVHANEFVFDAQATRRIGVPALEAMRTTGKLGEPGQGGGSGGSKISITQGPGTYVEAVERSDGEIEIIAERVARRVAPGAVASDMRKGSNSVTGKALGGAYGLKRADR
jgi:hypothetical protein